MSFKFYKSTLKIGTRKSTLARAQTKLVGDALKLACPDLSIEYIPMNTLGDKRLDISLQQIGGKGVFTKELEEALIKGEIDLAIHSAKDLPLEFDKRLKITSVLKRAKSNDVLVLKKAKKVQDPDDIIEKIKALPGGFRIGTSSKRRGEQILLLNSNLNILPIRGNILTRISKILEGDVEGIILARAGIDRLLYGGESSEDREILNQIEIYDIPEDIFPGAPAQGILCAQYSKERVGELLKQIRDPLCNKYFLAERKYLSFLKADCNTSAGIYIDIEKGFVKAYFGGQYAKICGIHEDEKSLFNAVEKLAENLLKKEGNIE